MAFDRTFSTLIPSWLSAGLFAVLLAPALLLGQPGTASAGHEEALKDLEVSDMVVGSGEKAVLHSQLQMHYTGWLMDGTKFDSSVDRGAPFAFVLGTGSVIPGWEIGVEGMRVGGKRELIIPSALAYGEKGSPGVIPPNAKLRFEVELISATGPKYTNIDNDKFKELAASGVPIVDIRTAEEWKETGVVEGSKLLTAWDDKGKFQANFIEDLGKIAGREEEVILICRTGNRTSQMANALSERLGYTKVYNLENGIVRWMKDGNPVVKN